MRVELERSGGVAGVTRRWSLDVDELDDAGRAEVHALLAQVPAWAPAAGADRFSYRVLVAAADGPAPVDVRLAEPLPPAARRLVELVRGR